MSINKFLNNFILGYGALLGLFGLTSFILSSPWTYVKDGMDILRFFNDNLSSINLFALVFGAAYGAFKAFSNNK